MIMYRNCCGAVGFPDNTSVSSSALPFHTLLPSFGLQRALSSNLKESALRLNINQNDNVLSFQRAERQPTSTPFHQPASPTALPAHARKENWRVAVATTAFGRKTRRASSSGAAARRTFAMAASSRKSSSTRRNMTWPRTERWISGTTRLVDWWVFLIYWDQA